VARLRAELDRLRAEAPVNDVLSALRVVRPTLGPDAAVGLYRLLRLAAFDRPTSAEAIAAARAAGEKVGRSLGLGSMPELLALARNLSLGVVEAPVVAGSGVTLVVGECVACAGAHESGQPICHFESGLIAGAIASIFGRAVTVRETACLGGCGDDACRFEVSFT
jgi:predicted hydrocarbon binding protein